jgi:dienelactone hydrolase
MTRVDVSIPASDGSARGTLHVPAGDGPWPGVLLFPDAGGYRETFGEMGDHLAGLGFVALVPDIYYRAGEWAPFDVNTLFTDDKERARMFGVHRRTGRTARQRAHRRRGRAHRRVLPRPPRLRGARQRHVRPAGERPPLGRPPPPVPQPPLNGPMPPWICERCSAPQLERAPATATAQLKRS